MKNGIDQLGEGHIARNPIERLLLDRWVQAFVDSSLETRGRISQTLGFSSRPRSTRHSLALSPKRETGKLFRLPLDSGRIDPNHSE